MRHKEKRYRYRKLRTPCAHSTKHDVCFSRNLSRNIGPSVATHLESASSDCRRLDVMSNLMSIF